MLAWMANRYASCQISSLSVPSARRTEIPMIIDLDASHAAEQDRAVFSPSARCCPSGPGSWSGARRTARPTSPGSRERIGDCDAVIVTSVAQILRPDLGAPGRARRLDDCGIPVRDLMAVCRR